MTEQKFYRPLDEAQLKKDDPRNVGDLIVDKLTVNETLTQTGAVALAASLTVGTTLGVTGRTTFTGGTVAAPVLMTTGTYAVLAANSGKLHIIPDVNAITATLPAPVAGLNYEFMYYGANVADADHIIKTTAITAPYKGGVLFADLDGNAVDPVYLAAATNNILTLVKPEAGTFIKVVCNGTDWYVTGTVASATVPTFSGS